MKPIAVRDTAFEPLSEWRFRVEIVPHEHRFAERERWKPGNRRGLLAVKTRTTCEKCCPIDQPRNRDDASGVGVEFAQHLPELVDRMHAFIIDPSHRERRLSGRFPEDLGLPVSCRASAERQIWRSGFSGGA